MTNEQKIDQELNIDFEKFTQDKYKGKGDVPENFIELFKASYMSLAPKYHQMLGSRAKFIGEKTVEQLTVADIRDGVGLILNTQQNLKYNSFEEAVQSQRELDVFTNYFNEYVKDFTDKIKMRKVNLMSLSSSKMNGSNLRILN